MAAARPDPRRHARSACVSSRLLGGVLSLACALAAACDFPEPEACALACGPAGECPSAFVCQPQTLLCAPRGQTELCSTTVVLPSGDDGARPDAGEAPSEPPPNGPPDAGEGSEPAEPPSGALSIERGKASPACTGAELELELGARGGEAPYAWRLLQAPAGVQLSAPSGGLVALSGAPEVAGPVLVELIDGAGRRTVSAAVTIRQRPSIETSALPALCAGAGYSAPLDGWGGDAETLLWSARVVTDDARLSLEELGLRVVGSTLSAASIPEGLEPGTLRLELGLSDGWCEADGVELELDLATLEAEACPSLAIAGLASGRLPPPCRGNRYTETASVEGGVPPFTWTELASPPGLYFDVESGVIDGVPSDDGELVVAVTDGAGRTVEAAYDVSVRDQCWLAFVAGGVPPARLALVDPRLLERQPENARREFPEAATAAAVEDYRFSPDGRFIAYRSGRTADALGLELVRVVDGASAPIALPEPAAEYAWSTDSAILFVATGATQRSLHAVDVSTSAGESELDEPGVLGARSIPTPSGPLVAYGSRQLAFLAPDGAVPPRTRLVTTGATRSGVAPPSIRSELDFSASARVEGVLAGALVTDPETGLASFFPGDGRAPAAHADALPPRAGTLVARAVASKLALFDAADASAPTFEAAGCARLLARGGERDRFACASDGGALAFFELHPSGLAALTASGAPASIALLGARRVFSPSGRWFASADDGGLSVWSLEPPGPRRAAALTNGTLGATATTLSFSPDEGHLVIGAGNRLQVLELGGDAESLLELGSSALLDDGCSERAVDGMEQWCGSDSGLSVLRWAPGSDAVAFRSVLGTLTVIDVSAAADGRIGRALAPDADCDEACVSSMSARFQP